MPEIAGNAETLLMDSPVDKPVETVNNPLNIHRFPQLWLTDLRKKRKKRAKKAGKLSNQWGK